MPCLMDSRGKFPIFHFCLLHHVHTKQALLTQAKDVATNVWKLAVGREQKHGTSANGSDT